MKTLKILLLLFLFIGISAIGADSATVGAKPSAVKMAAAAASSGPYLVCDPYNLGTSNPTEFLMVMDGGAEVSIGIFTNTNGTVQVKYDLASIASGSHTVTLKAKNDFETSGSSTPFTFVKAIPSVPTGLAMSGTFLISANYANNDSKPSSFLVTVDGAAEVESAAYVNTDGTVKLRYDLKSIASGSHTITVKAKNMWGVSDASSPFSFTRQPLSAPSTVGLSGN